MVICVVRSNSAALQCVDRIVYDSIRHHGRFQNLTEERGDWGGGGWGVVRPPSIDWYLTHVAVYVLDYGLSKGFVRPSPCAHAMIHLWSQRDC